MMTVIRKDPEKPIALSSIPGGKKATLMWLLENLTPASTAPVGRLWILTDRWERNVQSRRTVLTEAWTCATAASGCILVIKGGKNDAGCVWPNINIFISEEWLTRPVEMSPSQTLSNVWTNDQRMCVRVCVCHLQLFWSRGLAIICHHLNTSSLEIQYISRSQSVKWTWFCVLIAKLSHSWQRWRSLQSQVTPIPYFSVSAGGGVLHTGALLTSTHTNIPTLSCARALSSSLTGFYFKG